MLAIAQRLSVSGAGANDVSQPLVLGQDRGTRRGLLAARGQVYQPLVAL